MPLFFSGGIVLADGRLLTDEESVPLRPPEAKEVDSPGYNLWLFRSGAHRTFIGISGMQFRAV